VAIFRDVFFEECITQNIIIIYNVLFKEHLSEDGQDRYID